MSSIITRKGPPPVQGRSVGPLRARCEVLARGKIGSYHSLTFVAPDIAERAQPGQFVSVGVDGVGTVLRRPFSIYQVSRHGPWAGTVQVTFEVVGPGTQWLSSRDKHDLVDLVGPLGTPFPLPQQPVSCLLVGGGYGAAPLLYLAGELQQRGFRVDMVIGARTADRVFNAIEAKRVSATTIFTTEDGSLGSQGRVTDVLPDVIAAGSTGLVYACGPMPMLAAVSQVATDHDLPVRVAVEEAMACGTGVCWTCVLPVERRGEVHNLRACTEGPVFNGAKVRWEQVGEVVLGAPAPPEELTP